MPDVGIIIGVHIAILGTFAMIHSGDALFMCLYNMNRSVHCIHITF